MARNKTKILYRPDDLDALAIEEWDRLLPLLSSVGEENYLIVAQICRVESRRKQAQREINQVGLTVEGQYGPIIHPLLRVVESAEKELRALYRELQITPALKSPRKKEDAALPKTQKTVEDLAFDDLDKSLGFTQ